MEFRCRRRALLHEKSIPVCNHYWRRKLKDGSVSRTTGRCIDLTLIPRERWGGGTLMWSWSSLVCLAPSSPSSGSLVAMAINHHADDSHMWRRCRISMFTSSSTANVWLRCQSVTGAGNIDKYTMCIPAVPTKMKFAFFFRLFRNLFLAQPALMFVAVATGRKTAAGLLKQPVMLSVCKDYSFS